MKKYYLFVFCCFFTFSVSFAQPIDSENPDCIYAKNLLGDCIIHMKKITTPFKGSAPAIEMLSSAPFIWEQAENSNNWGADGENAFLLRGCCSRHRDNLFDYK